MFSDGRFIATRAERAQWERQNFPHAYALKMERRAERRRKATRMLGAAVLAGLAIGVLR